MPNLTSKTYNFFFFLREVVSRLHLELNRSKKDGIQGRHSMVKNRQRWKNNQVRKQRTKEQVCILGRKKSKVTLTQSPWEKREEARTKRRNL